MSDDLDFEREVLKAAKTIERLSAESSLNLSRKALYAGGAAAAAAGLMACAGEFMAIGVISESIVKKLQISLDTTGGR